MAEDHLEIPECHVAEDTVTDLDDQKIPDDPTELEVVDLEDGNDFTSIIILLSSWVLSHNSSKRITFFHESDK